jgi:hypothetical protein
MAESCSLKSILDVIGAGGGAQAKGLEGLQSKVHGPQE